MASNNKSPLIKPNMIKRELSDPNIVPNPVVQLKTETGDIKPFSTERLTSFRVPRDLTLGGLPVPRNAVKPNLGASNANKRVYTPNLNAIRNRNVDVKTSRDTTKTPNTRGRGKGAKSDAASRGTRGGRGGRGAGQSNSRTNVVSSAGLFSEGAGDGTTRRLMGRYRSSNDAGETASTLRKPSINKKERVDPKIEQQQMREIYDLDEDPMEGEQMTNEVFGPINLLNLKQEIKPENDVVMNVEPTDHSSQLYPSSADEFFTRTSPQIFLLQLPDTLPGHGPVAEPAESAEHERSETPDPQASYCTMAQLDEGRVGRLIRYKSGRIKLILGESKFDIGTGIDPGHLQEIVSINTNSAERSGNMINLGQVNAKFSAIPDWEFILHNQSNDDKS